MNLELPPDFEQKLELDRSLRAAVDHTINDFSIWFDESKLPFFEDYTNHGIQHIQNVIQTLRGLVTPESLKVISSADVATLIIATLLHDSALHLSEGGFSELIHGHASDRQIHEFDSVRWINLWEDFLYGSRRWDDRKLRDVFGDASFEAGTYTLNDPFERYTNLRESDKKLIGEFIRSHHPRLAHEFAVFGVPGPAGKVSRIQLEPDRLDIAGLVARSHGMEMRPCIDYLLLKGYQKRTYKDIHVPYLMCLIRVADYLQIDASRAPNKVFHYKHIPSPLSRLEWEVHGSIADIHCAGDDPESIHVNAKPSSVHAFLRLKEWLNGIQVELDNSWAVLGEVYGRVPPFDKFGLTLRRIRSNLDDLKAFRAIASYVPVRVELDVARAELLRLLIGPLYGEDNPQIGVRELVQNAVDAVRERTSLRGPIDDIMFCHEIPDVDVAVCLGELESDGTAWLTVQDRGVGMSEEVIRDYFLRAGASFRNSEVWQKDFEEGDTPGVGSRVVRTGRFGVGALAAFLLGDEIHVETRKIGSNEGFRFSVRIFQDPISLERVTSLPVGTTVRVRVDRKCHSLLSRGYSTTKIPARLGWYRYTWPKVARVFEGKHDSEVELGETEATRDGTPSNWVEVPVDEDYQCYWAYCRSSPALTCNGIWVNNSQTLLRLKAYQFSHSRYEFVFPKISIIDRNAAFPLTLTRDATAIEAYPFEENLVRSVIVDWFAYLIANTPLERPLASKLLPNQYPGWLRYKSDVVNGKFGVLPFDSKLLAASRPASIVYFFREDIDFNAVPEHDVIVFVSASEVDNFLLPNLLKGDQRTSHLKIGETVSGVRALIKQKEVVEEYAEEGNSLAERIRLTTGVKRSGVPVPKKGFVINDEEAGWCVIESEDCPDSLLSVKTLTKLRVPKVMFIEQFLKDSDFDGMHSSLISELWEEVIGHQYIPYSIEDRRRVLCRAYERLGDRISYYEGLSICGERNPEPE